MKTKLKKLSESRVELTVTLDAKDLKPAKEKAQPKARTLEREPVKVKAQPKARTLEKKPAKEKKERKMVKKTKKSLKPTSLTSAPQQLQTAISYQLQEHTKSRQSKVTVPSLSVKRHLQSFFGHILHSAVWMQLLYQPAYHTPTVM